MDQKEIGEMLDNKAEVEIAQEVLRDGCVEDVVFLLKDQQGHKFSIGIFTIMECLEAAILHGDVPRLPESWCDDVASAFGAYFEENAKYRDEYWTKGGAGGK